MGAIVDPDDYQALKLQLSGLLRLGEQLHRNVLLDQLYACIPRDEQVKVLVYNAELAPGGFTNWHCHNGATFFVALQGMFEAHFHQEGVLVRAKAGDVYSEPIGKFHRGHNPHPEVPPCSPFAVFPQFSLPSSSSQPATVPRRRTSRPSSRFAPTRSSSSRTSSSSR